MASSSIEKINSILSNLAKDAQLIDSKNSHLKSHSLLRDD